MQDSPRDATQVLMQAAAAGHHQGGSAQQELGSERTRGQGRGGVGGAEELQCLHKGKRRQVCGKEGSLLFAFLFRGPEEAAPVSHAVPGQEMHGAVAQPTLCSCEFHVSFETDFVWYCSGHAVSPFIWKVAGSGSTGWCNMPLVVVVINIFPGSLGVLCPSVCGVR